jgi:hypothetical protein
MTTLITLLVLALIVTALASYARHDGLSASRPRPEPRDELDKLHPHHVFG